MTGIPREGMSDLLKSVEGRRRGNVEECTTTMYGVCHQDWRKGKKGKLTREAGKVGRKDLIRTSCFRVEE